MALPLMSNTGLNPGVNHATYLDLKRANVLSVEQLAKTKSRSVAFNRYGLGSLLSANAFKSLSVSKEKPKFVRTCFSLINSDAFA